jgi:hypothetical protein
MEDIEEVVEKTIDYTSIIKEEAVKAVAGAVFTVLATAAVKFSVMKIKKRHDKKKTDSTDEPVED